MQIQVPQIASQRCGRLWTCAPGRLRLLPRPISLCGFDRENGTSGWYTGGRGRNGRIFAFKAGDTIDVLGPWARASTPPGGRRPS